jgi:SNF2 family DNA or RNA helicase
MNVTAYHAKYYAHDLTRRASSGLDRLSMSLFDAAVDLNPHQIEAALFALESPLSKGVLLADEVGLGKTIEAGIVLCQLWAERKRRLLVICPASLRKQWALELAEKFNLPARVLDAKTYKEEQRVGRAPLNEKAVLILSFNYANALREEIKAIAWDMVVIDEAHKLRNAYRPSNKVGQGVRWATEDCRKLLLTATPLQNSLVELYGLSTLIDEHLFGDINAFRTRYASAGSSITDLRQRLATFCKRTLRNQVTEYVRYTERRAITRPFTPSDAEHSLYEAVSSFLQRPNSYALPLRQRHLTALILRKLLASSSLAIAGTLDTLRTRLETLRDEQVANDPEFAERLIEAEDIEDELLDDILADDAPQQSGDENKVTINRQKLKEEIELLERLSEGVCCREECFPFRRPDALEEVLFERLDPLLGNDLCLGIEFSQLRAVGSAFGVTQRCETIDQSGHQDGNIALRIFELFDCCRDGFGLEFGNLPLYFFKTCGLCLPVGRESPKLSDVGISAQRGNKFRNLAFRAYEAVGELVFTGTGADIGSEFRCEKSRHARHLGKHVKSGGLKP